MEDGKTTEPLPPVDRGEGWKPRHQRKRTLLDVEPKPEDKSEEEPRTPQPLPFGTIDILA
ncbi:MAG: hypothetical protein C4524_06100 [Candidatus Zixiibacteriota bacterium]|nr:MAG: hypothetical protein C4524_06100 [candidate division Zixibacteria bacterium]